MKSNIKESFDFKDIIRNVLDFLWKKVKNPIPLLAAIALLIPDVIIRTVVPVNLFPKMYSIVIPAVFTACWIVLLVILCRLLPRKIGRFVFLVLGLAMLALAFSNFVYFKIFGQFFWLNSIGLAGEAGNYTAYALEYVSWPLIVATLLDLALLIFVTVKWNTPGKKRNYILLAIELLVPISVLVSLHVSLQPSVAGVKDGDWDAWRKPQIVYKDFTDANKSMSICGLYQITTRDLFRIIFPAKKFTDEEYAEATAYFESRPKPQNNEYTNIFEGKNVIAVMLESFDEWMVNETYTPTINYMMKNGINFTDYYASPISAARTFNTEFAFNTGFYTPKSVPSAVVFSTNHFPYSMPNLFKEKGYSVNSFHYNDPEFYNRGIMHKSFGYEKYHSFINYVEDPLIAQADSNILKYDAIYEDMTKNQPFFDFVISYSGHVPYTFDDAKLATAKKNHPELVDPNAHKETNNLLVLAADTDDFFRQLLTRLHNDGLLENTVIIGFSDHYAYGFSDRKLLAEYGSGLYEKVPAFIYTPGLTPVEINKTSQTVDLMPTIINMFGLTNHNCYVGSDIFDERYEGFVQFEQGLWYDGVTYFNPDTVKVTPKTEEYVRRQSERANTMIRITDIVISGDYFRVVK